MLNTIKKYIKFWLKSTNQHGVHSPFVYDLITKCFYDKTHRSEYKNLLNYRKELLNTKTSIAITDLGAGSQVMKTQTRVVKHIASHAGSTVFRSKLLLRLVDYFKFEHILELGTSLGIATYAMHLGNPKASITTIEGCPNTTRFTRKKLIQNSASHISLLNGDFGTVIPLLEQNSFDFIYIDGNHQKEATIHYFESLLNKAHQNTVFVFDDIYWSKGMTEAWETIKQHPKVTVSIDTFFWGFIFLRTELQKEHFTIRL